MPSLPDGVSRRMRAVLAVSLPALVAFVVVALTSVGGPDAGGRLEGWVADATGLTAVLVCAWRAKVVPTDRAIWGIVALGLGLRGIGNAYYNHVLAYADTVPLPSLADALFLPFYPLMYIALVLLMRQHGRSSSAGLWLDGLIGATACAALGTAVVLAPVLDEAGAQSTVGALTIFAYPAGDLLLIAMLALPVATLGARAPFSLLWLGAGLVVFAVCDSYYALSVANGTYVYGGIVDLGWLLAPTLMALGATIAPARSSRRVTRSWGHPVVPATAGIAAVVVLILQAYGDPNPTSVTLAALTLTLVTVRMSLSLRETGTLLDARAHDAVTDSLTGLANRRALLEDLEVAASRATAQQPVVLVILDLDGFKVYNDTFGHLAGDALLRRIAEALRGALGERGRAYRMGGDEFCVVATGAEGESPERLGAELAAAMAQHGEGFSVTATYGSAAMPRDEVEATALLRHADDEMYARKVSGRPEAEHQVQDALLAALRERDPDLQTHSNGVAELAAALGRRLELGSTELRSLVHAAALHDVGQIAIPHSILDKRVSLDEQESQFIRSHPLIAQRIISAAPSLGYAAELVRSVHERWDGEGYPDGLRGEAIPLGARMVAVCDGFHSMTKERGLTVDEAIDELRRAAGTRFDPRLVATLIDLLRHPEWQDASEDTSPTAVTASR